MSTTARSFRLGGIVCALAALALGARQEAPDGREAAQARLDRGLEALGEGRPREAERHLREAWVHAPRDPELARHLVDATEASPDLATLWARTWLEVSADSAGRSTGERGVVTRFEALAPHASATERARAAAIVELNKLAQAQNKRVRRSPSAAFVERWARELAVELARDVPAQRIDEASGALALPTKLPADVIASLERAFSSAQAQGRVHDAVGAARILRGLAVQGGFKDLQGAPPRGLQRLSELANEALERSRRRLTQELGEPLTVDQLLDMDEDQAREFTRVHADMANPGVALTPRGWYRVETCCGWETLLGVAETLELHHERLAGWYGQDPFVDRPGLARVVPEAAGLEAEGAPFWWAGGFQGGDTTVMRFSCGTIEGLGHGLTHELTHRFDGALYPGQPAWLSEGKAVWTGGSYGDSRDDAFVERHIQFGTVEGAWIKGYGGEQKLRELIEGEIEDYRDNYVAGYALYVYLKLWEREGQPVFAPRLEQYMLGCGKHAKDPLGWFVECFADGEAGRPQDFTEFASGFQTFGRGFYWDDRAEWTGNYVESVPQAGGDWVYDEPTWTWSRSRAEPYFGQDHAWRAGVLLEQLDKQTDAVRAYVWASAVDERAPQRDERLARLLAELGEDGAAWVLRNEVERPYRHHGDAWSEAAPCPLKTPKTDALLEALAVEARGYASADLPVAAAALRADHDRLARALGRELLPPREPGDATWATNTRELESPEERLGLGGWIEDGLTSYEERRAEHCWYVEQAGDLHVGRFRPRDSSGALDRAAHNRHAFTRTLRQEFAGRYLVRCRIQFTTSYVSGALVLGYGRRDRNLRLGFSAGDFYYSIGKKEQQDVIESVGWRLRGLRDRDGPLQGSLPGGRVEFDEPRTNFELAVIVDEAAAHVWIEGRYVGTYHTVDGAPIVGAVGFATSTGAMRVIDPRVQRLDRGLALGLACTPNPGDEQAVHSLDFARPARGAFTDFVNQRVRGLRAGSRGSLFVWAPLKPHDEVERGAALDRCLEKAEAYARTASALLADEGAALPIALAVPALLGEERLAGLAEAVAGLSAPGVQLYAYEWAPEDEQDLSESPGASKAWLGFVDSAGVLRGCTRLYGFTDELPAGLLHWVTVFKDNDQSH